MHDTDDEELAELAGLIRESRAIVAFTGAGISTESGVPDFRSPGSPWTQNKPIPFDQFVRSPEVRREAWRRKFRMDDVYRGARPNRAHHILTRLVERGRMLGVITQNIDGLHHQAGLSHDHVVELHGNGTYAACLSCGQRHELTYLRAHFEAHGDAPDCGACGGIVKTATISFGQAMPEDALLRAQEMTLAADLFLVLGSSLVVYPAASLPVLAKRNGARLVILNREPTPMDDIADVFLRRDIGDALSRLSLTID